MNVLIVKMSSMGDVIHTLPALTDASRHIVPIRFDWVVEEAFAEIPSWHPAVDRVIPMAWRRWRKQLFKPSSRQELQNFLSQLRAKHYDLIIDAQGLLKSAIITYLANGLRTGLDYQSAREPLASFFYQKSYTIPPQQHAIQRMRQLFACALNYTLPQTIPDYGLQLDLQHNWVDQTGYVVLIHGTSRDDKLWDETQWINLAKKIVEASYSVKLPWGNEIERMRAQRIAQACKQVEVLPKLKLQSLANLLSLAKAAVAVDTGLGHLAAAVNLPTISLYGPTNPSLIGTLGKSQIHLTSGQKSNKIALSAEEVWGHLKVIL